MPYSSQQPAIRHSDDDARDREGGSDQKVTNPPAQQESLRRQDREPDTFQIARPPPELRARLEKLYDRRARPTEPSVTLDAEE